MAEHEQTGRKRGKQPGPAAKAPVIEGTAVEIPPAVTPETEQVDVKAQESVIPPAPDAKSELPPHITTESARPVDEPAKDDSQPAMAAASTNETAPSSSAPSLLKMLGAGAVGALLASGGTLMLLKSGAVTLPAEEAIAAQKAELARTIDTRLASLPQQKAVDLAPVTAGLDEAKARSDEMAARIQQLETLLAQTKAATQSTDASINAQMGQRMGLVDQALAEAKVARQGLDERLKTIENADTSGLQRKLGAALAMDSLRNAFERGMPFADALKTATPFVEDQAALAALQAVAVKGQAGAPALVRQFEPVAKAMLAAQPPVEGGFWARVSHSLSQIITVRRKGEAAGETPQAFVLRIENALAKADRAGALAAYAALPQPMQAAGTQWAEEMKAGIAAEKALKALHGNAIGQLGGHP